jgi:UMF1 family MFS transporter
MTLMPDKFGLPDAGMAVRVSFVSVAVWWGFFTIFTILWVPEDRGSAQSKKTLDVIADGFRQFFSTLRKIRHLKTVLIFLLAYWFYIDGVDTIIRMAVDYGMSIGFQSNDLIKALLITQFVGFPAALLFGKLGQNWGVRKSIYLAIGIYICVTIWGTMMNEKHEFYILAIVIGLVQGGIQALSRSYYSRLIPKNKAAEFYGFYNMLGKFAAILGPMLMGVVGLLARRLLMPSTPTPEQIVAVGQMASRWGIGSILLLFITGAALFYFVDEEKGRAEIAVLSEE